MFRSWIHRDHGLVEPVDQSLAHLERGVTRLDNLDQPREQLVLGARIHRLGSRPNVASVEPVEATPLGIGLIQDSAQRLDGSGDACARPLDVVLRDHRRAHVRCQCLWLYVLNRRLLQKSRR